MGSAKANDDAMSIALGCQWRLGAASYNHVEATTDVDQLSRPIDVNVLLTSGMQGPDDGAA